MKAVVCGGHHTSALVIAEKLQKRGDKVYWFGHKYSMIGDKNVSAEYREVTGKNIEFVTLAAGKWQKKYKFWQNLSRIPLGFCSSFGKLLRIKPDIIISFGGYLALPVTISGWALGIPVVTHEQTVVSGLANKIISFFSQKIFITFEHSAKYFPKKKIVLTGLPVRGQIFEKGPKFFSNNKKTIFITGGKQGAHLINEAVFRILPELLKRYNIVHQTGSTSFHNDIEKAQKIKGQLKAENYLIKEYFFENEIGRVFNSADAVVSRAGAHTVYELLLLRKPAILIPIPWSNNNEQLKNAQMLKNLGLAKILPEKDLEEHLLSTILDFEENLSKFRITGDGEKHLKELLLISPRRSTFGTPSEVAIKKDAADRIISEIDKISRA